LKQVTFDLHFTAQLNGFLNNLRQHFTLTKMRKVKQEVLMKSFILMAEI